MIAGIAATKADLTEWVYEQGLTALPPSAQWAVLRACRFGKRLCDEVARAYLEREPILWLHRFWILRHPVDPPQLAGRASALD